MSRSGTALRDLKRAIVALEGRIAAAAVSVAPTGAVEHLAEWRKAVAERLDPAARLAVDATITETTSALPGAEATVPPISSTFRKNRP